MSTLLLLLCLSQVSDIAIAVREGADAVMLSGETAYGRYPAKALRVQSTVALRTEAAMTRYHVSGTTGPPAVAAGWAGCRLLRVIPMPVSAARHTSRTYSCGCDLCLQ